MKDNYDIWLTNSLDHIGNKIECYLNPNLLASELFLTDFTIISQIVLQELNETDKAIDLITTKPIVR